MSKVDRVMYLQKDTVIADSKRRNKASSKFTRRFIRFFDSKVGHVALVIGRRLSQLPHSKHTLMGTVLQKMPIPAKKIPVVRA